MRKRDRRRVRRRARTIPPTKLTSEELAVWAEMPPGEFRPLFVSECRSGERPCPWVGCRYHLYLDVSAKGGLKLNFPDLKVWEMPETCALDVAERGGLTLEEVGDVLNLTRERIRQMEVYALVKFKVGLEEERAGVGVKPEGSRTKRVVKAAQRVDADKPRKIVKRKRKKDREEEAMREAQSETRQSEAQPADTGYSVVDKSLLEYAAGLVGGMDKLMAGWAEERLGAMEGKTLAESIETAESEGWDDALLQLVWVGGTKLAVINVTGESKSKKPKAKWKPPTKTHQRKRAKQGTKTAEREKMVLAYLRKQEGEVRKLAEIVAGTGLSKNLLKPALSRLVASGAVRRTGTTSTTRYTLAPQQREGVPNG